MTTETPRRPDASMDLLNEIRRTALEPSYGEGPRLDGRRAAQRVPAIVTVLVIGLLGGVALGTTTRAAPTAAGEREHLITRIRETEAQTDEQRRRIAELAKSNAELETALAGLGAAELARLSDLQARTGSGPVTGPGLVVTVNDGPDQGVSGSRVVDADLRHIVNSLWASGAEAVAVNGHRLSSRTAIRSAGDAITVDYRSVSAPYEVAAIGDSATLEARFGSSPAAAWWESLRTTYGMRFDVKRAATLELAADPGLDLTHAKPAT